MPPRLPGPVWVVKAQIHAGKKAMFDKPVAAVKDMVASLDKKAA